MQKSFILFTLFLLTYCTPNPKSAEETKEGIDSVGSNTEESSTQPGNENTRGPEEIKIGEQTWTTANLDVSTFANGNPIQEAKTDEEWARAGDEKKPVWCYYDYDPAKGKLYGKLYNRYAVNDPRGLAPTGWHIPSDSEWKELTTFLGGENIEYNPGRFNSPAGQKMVSENGWIVESDNEAVSFGNESGFTALPGGMVRHQSSSLGLFYGVGYYAYWWSSTETFISLEPFGANEVLGYTGILHESTAQGNGGYSVRCVKGEAPINKNSNLIGLREKMPGKLLDEKIWQEEGNTYRTWLSIQKIPKKQFGGIYVYHWKVGRNTPEFQWAYTDTLSCGMTDLVISNDLDSLIIDDTDNDQLKEIIFIYTLDCKTDVSPAARYLVVLNKEGKIKLKLNGWSPEFGPQGIKTDARIENYELLEKLHPQTMKRLLELWASVRG